MIYMEPEGVPLPSTKGNHFCGTADLHFMYCNPCLLDIVMYFITEHTKHLGVNWWRDCGMTGLFSLAPCIRFSCSTQTFSRVFFSGGY